MISSTRKQPKLEATSGTTQPLLTLLAAGRELSHCNVQAALYQADSCTTEDIQYYERQSVYMNVSLFVCWSNTVSAHAGKKLSKLSRFT